MPNKTDKEVLRKRIEEHCVVTRDMHPTIILPNGEEAAWTFDFKNLLLDGTTLDTVASFFWESTAHEAPFQAGGLETTAIGLVAGVVMKAKQRGVDLNGFFIRKSRKKYDMQSAVEGELNEEKVILFDDILNSGKSFVKQIELLELLGKQVTMVCAIVRFREESYYRYFHERGIKILTLFSLDDFPPTGGVANYSPGTTGPERLEIPFSLEWKFSSGKPNLFHVIPKSAPAIDEKRVYFGADNGTMWAVNQADGSVAWRFDTLFGAGNKRIFSSPALWNGTIYFGSYDGNLYALDASTGAKKWVYREADWIGSSPCVAEDLGLVYVGLEFGLWNRQGGIAALDARTGERKWWHQNETLTHSSPAYSPAHRLVVVGSSAGTVFAFDARTGKQEWTYQAEGPVRASFALDERRGLVCFGSEDRHVYILETRTGKLRHKVESFEGFYSTPLVAEGKAYIGGLDKRILCIDLVSGKVVWTKWSDGRIFASPALIEGHLFIGSNDGRLYELDPTSGREIGFLQLTERIVNKIAYNPATKNFFVPTHANELYSFRRKESRD